MTRPTQGDRSAASPAAAGSRSATTTRSRHDRVVNDSGSHDYRNHSRAGEAAGPLAASWDPGPGPAAGRHSGRRGGRLSGMVASYGWRAYALPVLVVLTALTVFDSARSLALETSLWATAHGGHAPSSTTPLIPNPGTGRGVVAARASAELPGGGPFTVQGAGTWSVVPGAGPRFGTGQPVTYTVEVEDGVALPGGPQGFAATVDSTLQNPKSWIGSGRYSFQRTDDPAAADIRVTLASQQTTRSICGFAIPFDASCWKSERSLVVLNTARWARGAVAYQGNVVAYQQYVVNHEVGHGLGFSHVPCEATGQLAPIMMQQTWGIGNDYLAVLGTDRVGADGKLCEPNAWPFPLVN